MLWSSISTLLLHIPLCWLMVFKTSLGYTGAALAISISSWLNVFMLATYIRFSKSCKETRSPPTIEAFRGVGLFLRLALPSALMLCFEWWSFEILILLSGILPNPELQTSVLSICLTTIVLMYTIPYGLGAAASTRVANELGAGNPEGARSAVRVVMSIAVTEAVLITGALLASQHILGYACSSDKDVVAYVTAMVPFVCVSVAADSLQGVLSDLEWKLIYVGSAEDENYDQQLESVLVGPVNVGTYRFVLEADPPDPSKIREEDIIGVTVLLLTCSYMGQEFMRVGYYVNNDYDDEQLREEPPAKLLIDSVQRNILADKPRVTKFPINFHPEPSTSAAQPQQEPQTASPENHTGDGSKPNADQ